MKKMNKVIRISNELVPVSEEVYKEYYRMARRERYMEYDIKVGKSKVDPETGEVTYTPSKEDSIERLMDLGIDIPSDNNVEDIVCDKEELEILHRALAELTQEERRLYESIYVNELTNREIAELENVSHQAISKRNNKLKEKIKKYF